MARISKEQLVDELMLQELFAEASKKQVREFVEDFFGLITDKVVAGDEVSIPGFGKFEKYTRANGTDTPKFRPFTAFKDKVSA